MFEIRPFAARRNNSVENYNPFRDMDDLERAFFGSSLWNNTALSEFKTDIQDKGDHFLLEADLPGFKKEDIHIDVDSDQMIISGERHSEHENKDKKGNYVSCERSYGSYQRAFDMTGIDTDKLKAEYNDGVLKLTLPKKVETSPASRRLMIE